MGLGVGKELKLHLTLNKKKTMRFGSNVKHWALQMVAKQRKATENSQMHQKLKLAPSSHAGFQI